MPYAVGFPIAGGDQPPPPNLYRAMHANLLRWISEADPGLAAALHDRPVRKPFTISPPERGHNGDWRWRVTLLQDDLWEPLWAGVQVLGSLDLNGHTWPVRWSEAQVKHRSYALLLTCIRPEDYSIMVGFLGQVTFIITKARRLNQAQVWQLNALADYAEFCGTGRKTTHGMGQTRRVRR